MKELTVKEKASRIIDKLNSKDDKTFDVMCNLYYRWQDEKEYEDINDYLEIIRKHIPEAEKMTKRPFGVLVRIKEGVMLSVSLKKKGNYLQMEFGAVNA